MQKPLSFFVLHKICKVMIGLKFYKVDFIRLLQTAFYISIYTRPHPQQKPPIVF